jgi:hypothetical protein
MAIGTLDKLAPWADDGGTQVSAPSDAKVAHGWNIGEQPPNVHENWKNNRGDTAINDLIDLHDLHCENDYSDTIAARCSGLPVATALLNPLNAINRLDATSPAVGAICRGYDYPNARECVFGLRGTASGYQQICKITNLADGTICQVWITTNIPSGLTSVDLCCDGFFIYVLITISSETSKSHIYRVPIGADYVNGVATSYDAHIATTGCAAKPASRVSGEPDGRNGKRICVADATHIAFIDASSDGVCIIKKDLTGFDKGQGNYVGIPGSITGTGVTNSGICSDGTRVWCIYSGTVSDVAVNILCAALISNPAAPAAGLTRSWATNPVVWSQYELDVVTTGVCGLAYDGAAVNVLANGSAPATGVTHYSFVIQFDVVSEQLYLPRFIFPSGHANAGMHNGGVCFTGRRIAAVFPICPIEDLTTTDLWLKCNRYQEGLALLDPFKGGVDIAYSLAWGVQNCSVNDEHLTPLVSPIPPAVRSIVADVVFADGCIWVLRYYFPTDSYSVDAILITRIPAISARG